MIPLQVGDTLWFVPSRTGQPQWLTVEHIGRVWGEVVLHGRRRRFKVATLKFEDVSATLPGTLYRTKEEWEYKTQLSAAWEQLKSLTQGSAGDLTLDEVTRAIAILSRNE